MQTLRSCKAGDGILIINQAAALPSQVYATAACTEPSLLYEAAEKKQPQIIS